MSAFGSIQNSTQVLAADGLLAESIEDFTFRSQQVAMAEAVEDALHNRGTLVVEAGTGVGKTYAYLVPALLSRFKVICSTGTRHLQDQLFFSDLPRIQKIMGTHKRSALLKGRANYLCLYRWRQAEHQVTNSPRMRSDYRVISEWVHNTRNGDIAEVSEVSEQAMIWPLVTSTRDNCLGAECPDFQKCHVMAARRAAQEADLVVINHHLLLADLALKEEGHGELLPAADALILDEAHQVPEIARNFFGQGLSERQLLELVRDSERELTEAGIIDQEIMQACRSLSNSVDQFHRVVPKEDGKQPWQELYGQKRVFDVFSDLLETLVELCELLKEPADVSVGLGQCYLRAMRYSSVLTLFDERSKEYVHWLEVSPRRFAFASAPLNVARALQQSIAEYHCAWIYTSATLTASNRFDHFLGQVGLQDVDCEMIDSPFNYPKQAILYLPQLSVLPNDREYTQKVVIESMPLLHASEGNAFILFTSHRALKEAAAYYREHSAFSILVQGEQPKRELLQEFRHLDNVVLLGTQSFWEGVDVKGADLRLVVIDKLPFASPADPLMQAYAKMLEERGENPFMDFQLPQAILALKQGVGRLIRHEKDQGVIAIMDPRITKKTYGKSFLKSLPPLKRTDDRQEAVQFLEEISSEYRK